MELAIAETGVLGINADQATCESYRKLGEQRGMSFETVCTGLTWSYSPTAPAKRSSR